MIALTCKRALELILDAEPVELSLDGDTPLVAHLNSCDRCRRVAHRLAEQTVAIARVVAAAPAILARPARSEPAPRRRSATYGGLAAAAAIALLLFGAPISEPEPAVVGQGRIAGGTGLLVPPTVSGQRAPPAPSVWLARAPRREPRVEPIHVIAVEPERFPTPSAEAAVRRISDLRNAEPSQGISVVPPAGVRATVLSTANPAVTVVWLQTADTTRNPR